MADQAPDGSPKPAPAVGDVKASHQLPAGVASEAAPKQNPAFKAMGLPRIRKWIPGRNWLIFFGIVGSWTGAWYYDRWEKKRVQKKWCRLVEHMAQETLPVNGLQRRVTIILSAPPADGLMFAREHFHEYVKPVLVSSGLDWDVVEGRKEGDVRAGLAEDIRKKRKLNGETSVTGVDEQDPEIMVQEARERNGVKEWEGIQGNIVIGR
ncbi:hypothetical protein LTS18_001561, partial [Coniosporium uncinatum]